MSEKKFKILLAKPGLDGHDEGVKIVARALMDAGHEVIYTGLRKSAEDIAARAMQENVDVVGLSILSGSHVPLCEEFATFRASHNLTNAIWLVGGNIPAKDVDALKRLGVDAVFPFGSTLQSIVDYLDQQASEKAS